MDFKKFFKEKWNVILYFVFAGIVIYLVVSHSNSGYDDIFVEYAGTDFSQGWSYIYDDGTRGMTSLPSTLPYKGADTLYLENDIPEFVGNQTLIYRAKHTAIRVFIGGELRYDNATNREDGDYWFDISGIVYNEINLTEADAGKHIVIQTKSPMYKYINKPGRIYIGDRGSFFLALLREHISTIICGTIIAFLGIIMFVLWFLNSVILKNPIKELLCLSLFSFSASLWLFSECECAQLLMHDAGIMTVIAYEDLILIPIPMALYFVYYSKREIGKKHARWATHVSLVWFIICNGLHLFKIVSISETLIVTQVILGIQLLFISCIQISEIYYKSVVKENYNTIVWTIPLFGLIILVPLALMEVVKYAFFVTKYKNDGLFLSIGVVVYMLSLACDSVIRMQYKTEQYKESSEIKTQFLANMSHEIRTPLNAILGFNEVILRKSKDKTIRSYAREIQSAGNNLKGIINSILDISKIESGKLEIYSLEYDTTKMLDNIVGMFETLAKKKKLKLFTEIDERIPAKLIGDETHLTQVITNIMSNAVKYTEKGSVLLSVQLAELPEDIPVCKIKVSVKDTGIGIKPEDIEKLFDKFSRFDRERNFSVEGTGLGMNIVVQLLKAMGSEIKVESVYGEGSTFSFEIEQSVVDRTGIGSFEEHRKNRANDNSDKFEFIAPDAEILIVDDVQMNLDTASALLEQFQVKIDTALSGKEAVEKVQKKRYDLVLMDHMMPGMDGVEATETIRNLAMKYEDVYYASLPIIALTANAVVGMKEHFLQAGMQDFVSKPIEVDVLNEAIKKWLPKEKIVPVQKKAENEAQIAEETDDWGGVPEGFDASVAKKFCPSHDLFVKNIRTFANNFEATRDKLRLHKENGDAQNYMIIVHGLKSTSKMIGKEDISDMALSQEMYCKNNLSELVWPETEHLLEMYSECADKIFAFLGETKTVTNDSDCMSMDDYLSLMKRIKEAADNFDMAAFMDLEDELGKVNPPEEKKAEFDTVKGYVTNTEFGEVAEILKDIQ